jgi:hypothetical protein
VTWRRTNFPNPIKRAAFERSKGVCECYLVPQLPTFRKGCGRALGPANTFYEHIDPDWLQGRADLSRTCWKMKTATFDLPTIAKVKRQRDRARGIRGAQTRPMPGGRDDRLKKKMDGHVVERSGP